MFSGDWPAAQVMLRKAAAALMPGTRASSSFSISSVGNIFVPLPNITNHAKANGAHRVVGGRHDLSLLPDPYVGQYLRAVPARGMALLLDRLNS